MNEVQRQDIPAEFESRIQDFEQQGFFLLTISKEGPTYTAALENAAGVARVNVCILKKMGGRVSSVVVKGGWQELADLLADMLHLWQRVKQTKKPS